MSEAVGGSKSETVSVRTIIEKQSLEDFRNLLSSGYEIDVMDNVTSETALHCAFYANRFKILNIEEIYAKCKGNTRYRDTNGLTHVHVFAAAGNVQAIMYLLQRGESLHTKCYRDCEFSEFTALHFAALYKRVEMLKFLLYAGANVNVTNGRGESALHLACRYYVNLGEDPVKLIPNRSSAVKVLLGHGASVHVKDKHGRTPLYALFHTQFHQWFVRSAWHFDREQDMFNYKKGMCRYVDYYVQDSMNYMYRELHKEIEKIFTYFMNCEADATATLKNGDTLLHWAVGSLKPMRKSESYYALWFGENMLFALTVLLIKGVNVNARDKRKRTALQYAVHYLSYSSVRVLLEHGADVKSVRFDAFPTVFRYPQILPTLEVVENLINIIAALRKKGFNMSSRDHKAVLKFLLRNNELNKLIREKVHVGNFHYAINNLVCYGSAVNVDIALANLPPKLQQREFQYLCDEYVAVMHFYEDEKLLEKMKDFIAEQMPLAHELKKEMDHMRDTVLCNGISLFEFMHTSPQKAFLYLEIDENWQNFFTDEMTEGFKYFRNVIKGHIAKSLIRRYIILLLESLDNEDLLAACSEALSFAL